jgi:hypothetical protein
MAFRQKRLKKNVFYNAHFVILGQVSLLNSAPLDRGRKVFAEEWVTRQCKSSQSDTFLFQDFEERTIYETPHKPNNILQKLGNLRNWQHDKLWISGHSDSVGVCYHCQTKVMFVSPPSQKK